MRNNYTDMRALINLDDISFIIEIYTIFFEKSKSGRVYLYTQLITVGFNLRNRRVT